MLCSSCGLEIPDASPYCIFCGAEQILIGSEARPRAKKRNLHQIVEISPGEVPVAPKVKKIKENEICNLPRDVKEKEEVKKSIIEEEILTSIKDEILEEVKEEIHRNDVDCKENEIVTDFIEKNKVECSNESEEKGKKIKNVTNLKIGEIIHKRQEIKKHEYEIYHDEQTNLLNQKAFERAFEEMDSTSICIICMNVNNLKALNELKGVKYGDILIGEVAKALKIIFGENSYRIKGDDFAVLLQAVKPEVVKEKIELFEKALIKAQKELDEQIDIKVAIGYEFGNSDLTKDKVFEMAKTKMRTHKKSQKEIFNPNADGYYDDIKAEYEEIKLKLDRENIHKVVLTVIITTMVIILSIVLM